MIPLQPGGRLERSQLSRYPRTVGNEQRVGQLVTFLVSPVVGGIAGILFRKEECTTIPATEGEGVFEGVTYPASQICSEQFNGEIGLILTAIGWGICAVWFVLTVIGEHQASPPPAPPK